MCVLVSTNRTWRSNVDKLLLPHSRSPYYPLIILSCKKIHVCIHSFSNLTTTIFFFIIRYSNSNLKLKKRKHDNRDEKHVQKCCHGTRVYGFHDLTVCQEFSGERQTFQDRNGKFAKGTDPCFTLESVENASG